MFFTSNSMYPNEIYLHIFNLTVMSHFKSRGRLVLCTWFPRYWYKSKQYLIQNRTNQRYLLLECGLLKGTRDWETKSVELWTPTDVVEWIIRQLYYFKVKNPAAVCVKAFMETCGKNLMMMSRDNLETLIPDYGSALYHQLQMKILSKTIDNTLLCWERDLQKTYHLQSQEQPLDLKIKNCSSSSTKKQTSGKIRSHLVVGV